MQYGHDIIDWQRRAFDLAFKKGFHRGHTIKDPWHRRPARVATRRALIHSEIDEALEVVVRGKPDLYSLQDYGNGLIVEVVGTPPPGEKPEGLGPEIADVLIRTFDLAATLGYQLQQPREGFVPNLDVEDPLPSLSTGGFPEERAEALGAWLDFMHDLVSARDLQGLVDVAFYFAWNLHLGPWARISEKHAYNMTRPLRHGGKLI